MAKTLCKIAGAALVLAGIAGFVKGDLLGMHLTGIHNVIHLLTGAIALYLGLAGSGSAAKTFCQVFGVIYLLLGVVGFLAPHVIAQIIGADMAMGSSMTPDNIVHLLVGGVFVIVGFLRAS